VRYVLVLVALLAVPLLAKAQDANFRTVYSGALIATPINTNLLFTPHQEFQPLLSGSIEYSFLKTDKLGLEFSAGIYPYGDRVEETVQFGIRRFFAKAAPVGGYWEMMMVGGLSGKDLNDNHSDLLFGLGLRLGSIRTTRFGDFAFEYGGGPTIVQTQGQTQLRAEFFFGFGFLLGHDIMIEH
jgi:hypothetical protein